MRRSTPTALGLAGPLRHVGFGLAIFGAFLPWLRVAGSARDGFASADLLVSLAEVGLPSVLRWVGWLWYLGAFCLLAAWVVLNLPVPRRRIIGCVLAGVSAAAWASFAIGAGMNSALRARVVGPVVTVIGCALIVVSIGVDVVLRRRQPLE